MFTIDGTQTIEGFEARIILKDNAVPIFHKAYPVPFALRSIVEDKIDSLVKEGKIYQVFQSEWASPIVNVKKADGTYRTCVSFKRTVNPQIKPEIYPLPILEEVFATLSDGTVFVTLDLADAYTQLKIAPESAPLLTMNTHKGLYRYRRLIYGISSAAAIFQCTMDRILQDIPNVVCYIDDILIKGVDVMSCKETLIRVLERLEKHNVRLKLAKCGFSRSSIDYLGRHFKWKSYQFSEKSNPDIECKGSFKQERNWILFRHGKLLFCFHSKCKHLNQTSPRIDRVENQF